MTTPSPFDHRPDPELGAALRAVLSGGDDRAFAQRVVAAAEGQLGARPADWVDQLVRWARPGLAAALVLMAGAAIWLGGQRTAESGNLADPLRMADDGLAVPALLASTTDPDVDVVLAVALGN